MEVPQDVRQRDDERAAGERREQGPKAGDREQPPAIGRRRWVDQPAATSGSARWHGDQRPSPISSRTPWMRALRDRASSAMSVRRVILASSSASRRSSRASRSVAMRRCSTGSWVDCHFCFARSRWSSSSSSSAMSVTENPASSRRVRMVRSRSRSPDLVQAVGALGATGPQQAHVLVVPDRTRRQPDLLRSLLDAQWAVGGLG